MSQGISNASAKFNCLVKQLVHPHRDFTQTYLMKYLSIFMRNRVGRRDNHIDRLRAVLECMRSYKLYANASKIYLWCGRDPIFGILHWEERYSGRILQR